MPVEFDLSFTVPETASFRPRGGAKTVHLLTWDKFIILFLRIPPRTLPY